MPSSSLQGENWVSYFKRHQKEIGKDEDVHCRWNNTAAAALADAVIFSCVCVQFGYVVLLLLFLPSICDPINMVIGGGRTCTKFEVHKIRWLPLMSQYTKGALPSSTPVDCLISHQIGMTNPKVMCLCPGHLFKLTMLRIWQICNCQQNCEQCESFSMKLSCSDAQRLNPSRKNKLEVWRKKWQRKKRKEECAITRWSIA